MPVRDVILTVAMLFTLGIGFLVAHYALNTTVDSMIGISAINSSNGTTTTLQATKTLTDRMDYIITGVLIGMALAIIITSYFVGGHPIFMVIYFIAVVIGVIFSMGLSNIWEDVSLTAPISASLSAFPITNHILLHLPIYLVAVSFIGFIAMFAKPYVEQL